jgi:hypothetical protein
LNKFKIWGHEKKRFEDPASYFLWFDGSIWLNAIQKDGVDCLTEEGCDHLEVVWSIKLRDKKDDEIYAGDILQPFPNRNPELLMVVVWEPTEARYVFKYLNGRISGAKHGITPNHKTGLIVGNRFENPELLEVEE